MARPPLPVGVLADDMSGALASAGSLAAAGLRPVVQWRHQAPPISATALVADMRTRDYGRDPAFRARSWAAHLVALRCRRIELRIDSTLRGDPGAELAGTLAGVPWRDPVVLAVPGFPAAGRTVAHGRLRVLALDGPDTDIATVLFGGPSGAGVLQAALVEQGVEAVLHAIRESSKVRFVADTCTEDHLRTLAAVADVLAGEDRGLLTLSPGAWLRYLRPARPRRYILVVISSDTAVNHEQLARLRCAHRASVLHARALLGGTAAVDWTSVDAGADVLVVETISQPVSDRADAWMLSAMAARAADLLLDDGAGHDMVCAGIVVGGGQTGSALMDALGATRVVAHGEVAPLCPLGTVADGEWVGLPLITKGGLVGGCSTLTELVDRLREEVP
jgi:uncharacterized protein YgbK (DUF1537 family)